MQLGKAWGRQRGSTMTTKLGRNDPCHCGSGKKYKKCHMLTDEQRDAASTRASRLGTVESELTIDAFEFAAKRFGPAWQAEALDPFLATDETMQLLAPCAVYHVHIEGRPVAEWYRDSLGPKLTNDARACLDAEGEAWLSLWEVVESHPGEKLVLRDRLSGAERVVQERTASRSLVAGDTVLARVVEIDSSASINGMYPRALAPAAAADLERRARGRLRRKRDVPVDRLRDPAFVRYLIRRMEEATFTMDDALPELVNNDGDTVLLTKDHFGFEPDAMREVERRLAGMEGVQRDELDDGSVEIVFLGPAGLVLGSAWLGAAALRVETNSLERADELRADIEEACGPLLAHRIREHTDPFSGARQEDETEAPAPSPEEAVAIQSWKSEYYLEWLDLPLPALGGQTPRDAAGNAEGRAQLDALLADFEHSEQRLPPATRFDFATTRQALGLDRQRIGPTSRPS